MNLATLTTEMTALTARGPVPEVIDEGGWTTLNRDSSGGQLGEPGLWRQLSGRQVFELPRYLLDAEAVTREALRWALVTANDGASTSASGWQAPSTEEISGWWNPAVTTVTKAGLARQARVIHEADRLALRFDLVDSLPGKLSRGRRRWLAALIDDARQRWRLVRVGIADNTLRAEVDLTGAPQALLEPIAAVSADALRWVVSWLLEPVDFLLVNSDPHRALELDPARGEIDSPVLEQRQQPKGRSQ